MVLLWTDMWWFVHPSRIIDCAHSWFGRGWNSTPHSPAPGGENCNAPFSANLARSSHIVNVIWLIDDAWTTSLSIHCLSVRAPCACPRRFRCDGPITFELAAATCKLHLLQLTNYVSDDDSHVSDVSGAPWVCNLFTVSEFEGIAKPVTTVRLPLSTNVQYGSTQGLGILQHGGCMTPELLTPLLHRLFARLMLDCEEQVVGVLTYLALRYCTHTIMPVEHALRVSN